MVLAVKVLERGKFQLTTKMLLLVVITNSIVQCPRTFKVQHMYHILTTNNPENGLGRKGSRKRKVFPTERERRVHFKDRIGDLKNLIPNPTED